MQPPKINNTQTTPISTDFSKALDKMNSINGLVSKEAHAILMEMRKTAQRSHENIQQNSVLLSIEKEHNILEDLIAKLPDDGDRQELTKSFDELKLAFDKNTSWLHDFGVQLQSSFIERLEKNGGITNVSMLGDTIRSIKDSAVNSLPPAWRGLYDIAMRKYQEKKSRKEMVYENVRKNLDEYNENNKSVENEETTNKKFDEVSSTTNNEVTTNKTFEDISDKLINIENTQRQTHDDVISRLDDLILKSVSNEGGEIDSESYQNLQDSIQSTFEEGLRYFVQTASEEHRKVLETAIDTKLFDDLLFKEFEKLKNDDDFVDNLTSKLNSSQTTNREDELEVARSIVKDALASPRSDQSFSQKEAEESYQRDSVKEQSELNDNVVRIYKFISGKNGLNGKREDAKKDGGFIDKAIENLKGGLMGFIGGKASKLTGRLASTKVGQKVLNSKIGQKVLEYSGGNKLLSSMGVGNTLENVTKNSTETVVKDIAKSSTDDIAKTVAKEGAEKAATKTAGKTIGKEAAKVGMKSAGKSLLKKIPGVSLIAGGIFALQRALAGDFSGAAMELASGAAGTIPGVGTALSVGLDAGLAARDIAKETQSDQTEPRMRSVSIGGEGADDFSFDSLDDTPTPSKQTIQQSVPEQKSKIILPEVGDITDIDFDYSTFDPEELISSESKEKHFSPVNVNDNTTPIVNTWRTTKDDIYNKHIISKIDDGKVLERHISDVKDIKSDLKAYFDKRSFNKSDARRNLENEDIVETYNNALLKEVYGENYSVNITPYGVYDKNNDMAFTPVVKDERGIITKILKNTSDHIKPGEDGYISPDTNFFDEEAKFSEERNQLYDQTLSTRSTEEQVDRKRLDDLQEQSFWGGLSDKDTQEKSMLEQKINTSYEPVLTKEQENQYSVSGRMDALINKRVGITPSKSSPFSAIPSSQTNIEEQSQKLSLFDKIIGSIPLVGSIFSAFKSSSKPSVVSPMEERTKLILPDDSRTSITDADVQNFEEMNTSKTRDTTYTASSTRQSNGSTNAQQQQAPTIINNNYNTTNNTTTAPTTNEKPTPPPQYLVNPVPATAWQGTGWGGIR